MATQWTREMKAELANLWSLSATAVSPSTSKYERRIWASNAFHDAHPEVSSTAAYKELDKSPWTGGLASMW